MSKTNIYLNFQGNAEEAFNFYKSVFKTDWSAPIMRMGDISQQEVCRYPPGQSGFGKYLQNQCYIG